MKKLVLKNIIIATLILSFSVLPSFSNTNPKNISFKRAEAATSYTEVPYKTTKLGEEYEYNGNIYGENSGYYHYGQYNNPYSFTANNVLDQDIVNSVIGCIGISNSIQKAVGTIFNKKELGITSSGTQEIKKALSISSSSLDNSATTESPNSELSEAAKESAQIDLENKKREECFNGIVYYLTKKQLADITVRTVNWINSGYQGEAFFIRDQESFFGSIKDQTLQQLLGPFSDIEYAKNYPWGRDFARSMIYSAQYNAEDFLQQTLTIPSEEFNKSFLSGGWDEWLNMTQGVGNNPLSFNINASLYINNKINEKIENQEKELDQNNGFLSQKKCVEYGPDKKATIPNDYGDYGGEEEVITEKGICLKWETVTPGQFILNKMNWDLSSPTRQLELADDINSSLNQIFSTFIYDVTNRGLAGLDDLYKKDLNTNYEQFGGYGVNKVFDSDGNEITSDYYDSTGNVITVNKGSGWYTGDFDILTDLGDSCESGKLKKGVISTQKDYILAVREAQKEMVKIVPAIGNLDYCIPGPNPNWESNAYGLLKASVSYLRDSYVDDSGKIIYPANYEKYASEAFDTQKPWNYLNLPNEFTLPLGGSGGTNLTGAFTTIGAVAGSIIPGVGTAIGGIVGSGVGLATDTFTSIKSESDDYKRMVALLDARTKFEATKEIFITSKTEEFDSYKAIINRHQSGMTIEDYNGYDSVYNIIKNNEYLPMANAGFNLTKNISVYAYDVVDSNTEYEELIKQTNANIYKLNLIKKKVDKIVQDAKRRQLENYKKNGIYVDPRCSADNSLKTCGTEKEPTVVSSDVKQNDIIKNDPDVPKVCRIDSFSANKTIINSEAPLILSWKTTGCVSVAISGVGSNQPTSGSKTIYPKSTTTYTLYGSSIDTVDFKSLKVEVKIIPNEEENGGGESSDDDNSNPSGGSDLSPEIDNGDLNQI